MCDELGFDTVTPQAPPPPIHQADQNVLPCYDDAVKVWLMEFKKRPKRTFFLFDKTIRI